MKISFKNLIALPAALLVLASCATLKVTTDYDHSADFTALKTYSIYTNPNIQNQSVSALNNERIINAVKQQLDAKGYTLVASNPSFMVNVNTVVKNKQSVSATTDIYGYGGYFRPYGYWGGPGMATADTQFNVDEYKDGSIIIDVINAQTGKMVWEGIGNSEIDSGTLKNPDQQIPAAITKIMATFPNAGAQPAAKTKK